MRRAILTLAVVVGCLSALGGPLLGLLLGGFVWLSRGTSTGGPLLGGTLVLALVVMGPLFGLPLAWAGWRAILARPARTFRWPSWQWWLVIFGATLLGGQIVLQAGPAILMPAFHVAAGVLPSCFYLAVATSAARKGASGGLSRRAAAGGLAWGGLGGTTVALFLESAVALVMLIGVVMALSVVSPDLLELARDWVARVQITGQPDDLGQLGPLIRSPLVLLAILTLVGIVVPAIEELAKSLAVPLVAATGRRLRRLDGFLLGVAAGAGFALLEGTFSGLLALGEPRGWAALMLFRGAATAMHCAASGLAGLGWQALIAERAWIKGIGLGLMAAAMHGLWNFAVVGQTLFALGPAAARSSSVSVLSLLMVSILWLLWLAALGVLIIVRRQLSEDDPRAAGAPGTPAVSPTSQADGGAYDRPGDPGMVRSASTDLDQVTNGPTTHQPREKRV